MVDDINKHTSQSTPPPAPAKIPIDKVQIHKTLAGHRFFSGMDPRHLKTIEDCTAPKAFSAGGFLGKESSPADHFFLLVDGKVAIETYQPSRSPVILQTLHGGDIVGWSWLFPPYNWVFDARALTDVQTLAVDARCLRGKCDADTALGYDLMKRLSLIMTQRLKATRLQLLDLYGKS